jgi:hypothetical protein
LYTVSTKTKETKEERIMKKARKNHSHLSVVYPNYERPYPNAADPQYFIDKLVDGILSIATGMGATVVFVLLALL